MPWYLRCVPLSFGFIDADDDEEQASKVQLRHISDDIAKLQHLLGNGQPADDGGQAKIPTTPKSPLSLRSVRGVVDRLIKQVELQIPRSKKATAVWNGLEDKKVPASGPEKALEDACTQTSPLSMSCSSSFSWRSETAFPTGAQKEDTAGKEGSKEGPSSPSSSSIYSFSSASDGPNVLTNSFNHSAIGGQSVKWPLTSRCQRSSVRRKSFLSDSSSSNDCATKIPSAKQNASYHLPATDEKGQLGAKLSSQQAFEEGLRLLLLASASGFDDPKFADILSAIEPFAADLDLDGPPAGGDDANVSLKSASSPSPSPPCVKSSERDMLPNMPGADLVPKSESQVSSSMTASTSSPETPGRSLNAKGRRLLGHIFPLGSSVDCSGPASFATCFSDPCLKSSDYAGDPKSSPGSVGPRTWGPKIKSMAREGVGTFATKLQLKQLYRSDRRTSSTESKGKEADPAKKPSSESLSPASTRRTRSSSDDLNEEKATANELVHKNSSTPLPKPSMKGSRWLRRERSLAGERHRPPVGVAAKLARSKSLSSRKTASCDRNDSQVEPTSKRPTAIASLSVPQIAVARKYALLYLSCSLERSMPLVKPSAFNFGVQQFFKRKKSPEPTQPAGDSELIFGAPLTSVAKYYGQPLPQSIQSCMHYVEANAAGSVGVFRKSGVRSRIQRLKALCDNHDSIDFASFQVWDVADVIKLYFRELPEPLLTNSLSETFLYISLFLPERSKIDAIRKAVLLLPDENCQVLYALVHLLNTVAKYSATNQMDADNLAICFAPTLFYIRSMATGYPNWRRKTITSGFPSEKELKENRAAQAALAIMIKQREKVFQVSEDIGRSVFAKDLIEALPRLATSDQGAKFDINKHYDVCCGSLIKEHAEKWRGWSTEGSYYGAEVATKRAGDAYPLKMWRCWTEVQAPPKEVLFRILCERDLWDINMGCSRVLKKVRKRCDVFQYNFVQMPPLPSVEFCVLRIWETDMPEFRGGCVLIEFSVDHQPAEPLGEVQAVVLASRYVIEPAGRGRSRLTHISRIDLRGRSKAWYALNFGPLCARQIAQIRDSFLLKVTHGPETNL